MKKYILLGLAWTAATFSVAAQERVFALASAGEVDPALVAGMRTYLELNSTASVRLAPAVPMAPGPSLEDIGRAAAETMEPTDVGIIVLARSTLEQPQGICLPDLRFAVLNLTRLEVGAEAAQVERRAGQEGLRVMSMLLGMAPCPFPLCVLVGYEKVDDLDRMSANFCPPCLERFVRVAENAGIRLIPPPAPESEPAGEEVSAGDVETAPAEMPAEQEGNPAQSTAVAPALSAGEAFPASEPAPGAE